MTPAAQLLGAQAESEQAERDRLAACAGKAPLLVPEPSDYAALFASLPESDPDRHDFDPLDTAFAHLAPGYPAEEVAR